MRRSGKEGVQIENRPILAILTQVAEIEQELSLAQQEIRRREAAEKERDKVIEELQQAISEIKTLRGFLPICSHCKSIRDDHGYWKVFCCGLFAMPTAKGMAQNIESIL